MKLVSITKIIFNLEKNMGNTNKICKLKIINILKNLLKEEMATHSSILAGKISHGQRSLTG